ncbi:MAG: TIGR02301 family protein [Roseitalea sp.]|jgi:uncharacterized protein (TIGR02301 family)|nr:TIGR02301 family protein [Roseitalea sp.]MBO6722974.1 TIGR02301 family protein [Roseitalea sp.]MBO6744111.1 TIGR02301 family protein [Roseitalea sp.]
MRRANKVGIPVVAARLVVVAWLATMMAALAPVAAGAQTAAYDQKLGRLAEVLGSIHYLRNLCTEPSNQWRDEMEQLLSVEKPEPLRRAQLIAAFNKGYRSFDSVYTRCTDQARSSADRYVEEGRTLALDLASTYGAQ